MGSASGSGSRPGSREQARDVPAGHRVQPPHAGEPILGTPIDEAFIGSCVESRISDLRAAAAVLEGRRVASSIRSAWVVPGSNAVKAQAEAEGLDRIFMDAGFEWRESGCSKCYGSNGDYVEPGHRWHLELGTATTSAGRDGRPTPSWRARPPSLPRPSPAAFADVRTFL